MIKDGRLVAEFEQMYQDFDDPWCHSEEGYKEGLIPSDKAVVINLLKKVGAKRVIELGCGLGHFTNEIQKAGFEVLGVDISSTAIEKAHVSYPDCRFKTGDILDFEIYDDFRPDVVIMADITWYVLDQLDDFKEFLKKNCPETYLIHVLVTYPDGVQKYGADKFKTLSEIMGYFSMNYLEWGELKKASNDTVKTFFIGKNV